MLKPIKTPPFWAIFGHRWSQCTKGRNGVAVNSKFQALNARGEVMHGLYAVGDGCTIFGGLVLNKGNLQGMGAGDSGGAASKTAAQAAVPGGSPAGDMPMTGSGSQNVDFSKDEGSCCGGLGAAFISGYYAGMYVAEYLKSL